MVPHTFSIVEDTRVLLLFLCTIEKASLQSYKEILKDPLQELPADKIVFIHEKLCMLLAAARECEPWEFLGAELLEKSYSCEGLKSIEFNELKDFLWKDLPIFAIHKVFRENICYKLSEEVSHISVVGCAFFK